MREHAPKVLVVITLSRLLNWDQVRTEKLLSDSRSIRDMAHESKFELHRGLAKTQFYHLALAVPAEESLPAIERLYFRSSRKDFAKGFPEKLDIISVQLSTIC